MDYGAANKYDFDNPQKWVTVRSVPLLDEHVMTNEQGHPVARVDKSVLEQIAANNNKRVYETGDPATLILGHTSDDPRAEEKPAKGFVVGYKVKPFKRDPKTGQVIYAIHGDYKVRPTNRHLIEEYPRRSVELWWQKKELDPIAMLGGSAPERDLGVVIRNARLNHVCLDSTRRPTSTTEVSGQGGSDVIRFSVHGERTVETYSIEDKPRSRRAMTNGRPTPSTNGHKPKRNSMANPKRYQGGRCVDYDADSPMGSDDLFDGGDEAPDPSMGDEGDGGAEQDPLLAKVFQSKQWKDISTKLDMILQALEGEGESGMEGDMPPGEPGMEGMEGPGEMPPPGMGQGGPPGAGVGGPTGGDEGMEGMEPDYGDEGEGEPEDEAREFHGAKPVKMGGTAMPGPMNTFSPPGKGRFSRPRTQQLRANPTNARITALEQQNQELRFRYAKAEAEKIVSELKAEGVLFGQTQDVAQQAEDETVNYLAALGTNPNAKEAEADIEHEVNIIRSRYARKRPDPAAPQSIGLARFSRNANTQVTQDPEELGDEEVDTEEKAAYYGDLLYKMSRKDAVSAFRKRFGR